MPNLEFKGKQYVYSHHLSVPYREVIVDRKKSILPTGKQGLKVGNLILHGDSLQALKALLPSHAGRVQCIYADPPYNTGSENWCYNDNVRSPLMLQWLKDSANPVDRDDMERHDKWLCMMWPRLRLLHEILAETGVFFISIDENEIGHLRVLLDEIFSERNFLGTLVWKRRSSSAMREAPLSIDHEYVLAYAKNVDEVRLYGLAKSPEKYPLKDRQGRYTSTDLTIGMNRFERPNQFYTIKNPRTGAEYKGNPDRVWRFAPDKMKEVIAKDWIIWPDEHPDQRLERPRFKTYYDPNSAKPIPVSSWIETASTNDAVIKQDEEEFGLAILQSGMTAEGGKQLKELMGRKTFNYPKPLSLIRSLVRCSTRKNDVILDAYAGSGTTAHAVLSLNKEDGGSRQFVLVECEGYADSVTAERVRRVIKGVKQKKKWICDPHPDHFQFCRLGDEIGLEKMLTGKLPSYESIARFAFLTATGRALEKPKPAAADYLVGETDHYRVHLVYKPSLKFLRSADAALTDELLKRILRGKKGRKRVVVFAAARYISVNELTGKGVEYCQLPYSLYRTLGE